MALCIIAKYFHLGLLCLGLVVYSDSSGGELKEELIDQVIAISERRNTRHLRNTFARITSVQMFLNLFNYSN